MYPIPQHILQLIQNPQYLREQVKKELHKVITDKDKRLEVVRKLLEFVDNDKELARDIYLLAIIVEKTMAKVISE